MDNQLDDLLLKKIGEYGIGILKEWDEWSLEKRRALVHMAYGIQGILFSVSNQPSPDDYIFAAGGSLTKEGFIERIHTGYISMSPTFREIITSKGETMLDFVRMRGQLYQAIPPQLHEKEDNSLEETK